MGCGLTGDLFEDVPAQTPAQQTIAPGAMVLRGFIGASDALLMRALDELLGSAPLRHMMTPGGAMSVAMSNCGPLGWVSDGHGYRYSTRDPLSNLPWPVMPAGWMDLARAAAEQAGFLDFRPDACLINVYQPGARLSLHQDKDEKDFSSPIVSVSLGLPAVFMFGGSRRSERPGRYRLAHGDVVVWGGSARLAYHGIAPLADGFHALLGRRRINLTFRHAR
jgi:alkylated DNA repair protein (DNA oxidative demethylase)